MSCVCGPWARGKGSGPSEGEQWAEKVCTGKKDGRLPYPHFVGGVTGFPGHWQVYVREYVSFENPGRIQVLGEFPAKAKAHTVVRDWMRSRCEAVHGPGFAGRRRRR